MANTQISNKKLKAIVFTDIVDFTKLSAEDEQHALNLIDKQREIVKPIVEKHNGEWLKEIGDGLLFSFDSSLDAVNCSIEIQQSLQEIDNFKIRIGIHQGDIFIKDGDVFGDDVNIASRVEGFSPGGGITISDKVYKDIQGVKDIKTSFIGHKPLKGVSQETKIRCITSNGLPENKINKLPEFIGRVSMYFGILFTAMFSVFGCLYMLDMGNFLIELSQNETILFTVIACLNLGIVLMLFGFSNISFQRGVSIKSQKFIYYLSIIYITLLLLLFSKNLKIVHADNQSSVDLIGWILSLCIYLTPLIIFKTFQFVYNKIKY